MFKKYLSTLLALSLFINILFAYYFYSIKKINKQIEYSVVNDSFTKDVEKDQDRVIEFTGEDNPIFLQGTLKKENIPDELELGDYWYWIYFEEPYLLMNNASGLPLYIDKIQVLRPNSKDFYDLEKYIDKKVEIHGYQTWGYSESSVFQAIAIREL
ncbi:hypothetical protein H6802_00305 [Candidatus Nomurabacteria bacterium]|uniref:Uncharacterized protein n=1 Tax=candidate division WWE3 bacterium TaxID=2053526 RepID=A0A955DZS1_UNCKA|nr:hypothetical protein [candidate division WWE3 bacterium]MCB9823392.1 hypothetical protein [Candidatus Nomurabacteria bacterium]MCB9827674.1 hypothetical protein [Candidatus Nomurabacteria bacterium]HXK52841.1 hypothetical protein [bacterium]